MPAWLGLGLGLANPIPNPNPNQVGDRMLKIYAWYDNEADHSMP